MADAKQFVPSPSLPPPVSEVGVIGWLRKNLFATWSDTLLTLLAGYLLLMAIPPLVDWAFIKADWVGSDRTACDSGGACWVFVSARMHTFIYGFYNKQLTFLEPMVTLEFLQTKPDFSQAIPRAQQYAKAGRYPGRYTVNFDAASKTYRVSLQDLQ